MVLLGLLFRCLPNAEVSRWFGITGFVAGIAFLLEGWAFWSSIYPHLLPTETTPLSIPTSASARFLAWSNHPAFAVSVWNLAVVLLMILLLLTAIKAVAGHFQAPNLARRAGNLRWIIVGYSMFAPIPVVLFISLATHRTLSIKQGAGSIIPYFVALCYLVATISLLSLIFVNLSGVIRLVQENYRRTPTRST